MTKIQNAYFSMMAAVRLVLDEYAAVWGGSPVFSAAATHFKTAVLAALPAAIANTGQNSKGATANKQELRAEVETATEVMAGQIAVYAATVGDSVLRTAARFSHTAIVRSTDDGLVGKASRIAVLANAHIAALAPFGVTPAGVAALNAQSAAFSALIGTPKAAVTARKKAFAALEALRREGLKDLTLMDALMPLWRVSEPDFFARYFDLRRIPGKGHRHRALTVRVRNEEGAPVAGAILRIDKARIKRITSPGGQINLQHLAPGAYNAVVSKDGYKDEPLKVYISADKGTVLEVVLPNEN